MSAPPGPAVLLRHLREWRVPHTPVVRGDTPWYRHTSAGSFSNVRMVVNHHTGPYSTVGGMLSLLWRGRSDLPGPLCHFTVAPGGRVYLLSLGNANHAGLGDADVFAAVAAESYGTRPPRPDRDSVDGNEAGYGIEVMHPGDSSRYPRVQLESLVRLNAALCDFHGWTAKSCIQHYEWTARKIDMSWRGPKGAGDDLRAEIHHALRVGPAAYTFGQPDPPQSPPAPDEGDDMPTAAQIADAVWSARAVENTSTGCRRSPARTLTDIEDTQERLLAEVVALRDQVAALGHRMGGTTS